MKASPPLDGIRVLDFTSMLAGPCCTRLLADCGAEVIKIEPASGDYIRHAPPFQDGASTYFAQLNCGKKSVVLDLSSPEGHRNAMRLVGTADVVVENFRPGVMARLGLDYAALGVAKPDLVYCSISGYGQEGPRATEPAYAPIVHASSGFDMVQAGFQQGEPRPQNCGIFTADILAGVYGFGAIQTALIGRASSGRGQFIDLALFDAMINLLVQDCQLSQIPLEGHRLSYMPTRATDGWVIVTPITQRNFEDMAKAMGHEEWISDSRFATVPDRRANWLDLMSLVEAWTSARSAQDCEDHLAAAGVPCARHRTVAEGIADPQTLARGLMAQVPDAAGGFLVPNPPFTFSDGSVHARPTVPHLGQHTKEVLDTLT